MFYTLVDWLFTIGSWFTAIYLPMYMERKEYCIAGIVSLLLYPLFLETIYNIIGRLSYSNDSEIKKQELVNNHVGLPIVYHAKYNITACGIEKLHPFDSCKYERIIQDLIQNAVILEKDIFKPKGYCSRGLMLHLGVSKAYLLSLCYSYKIFRIVEIPVCILPSAFLRQRLLDPMSWSTQGSIDAAQLAIKHGWAINIGGGYHHASLNNGGGFCVYPDITLAIRYIRQFHMKQKIMIVDLDAHQGNGYEKDFLNDTDIHIVDFYNHHIYPHDLEAAEAITDNISVSHFDDDDKYNQKVKLVIQQAVESFQPQFLLYNAGTDCMQDDPLGDMDISPDGIVQRDQIMFEICKHYRVPILMVLSGGYQQINAPTIARSIKNLLEFLK